MPGGPKAGGLPSLGTQQQLPPAAPRLLAQGDGARAAPVAYKAPPMCVLLDQDFARMDPMPGAATAHTGERSAMGELVPPAFASGQAQGSQAPPPPPHPALAKSQPMQTGGPISPPPAPPAGPPGDALERLLQLMHRQGVAAALGEPLPPADE